MVGVANAVGALSTKLFVAALFSMRTTPSAGDSMAARPLKEINPAALADKLEPLAVPPEVIFPAIATSCVLFIVSAVIGALTAVPVEPAGVVWTMNEPPAPVPLPGETMNVKFAPATLLVPPASAPCVRMVCATGPASTSDVPCWMIPAPIRSRNVSRVDAPPGPNAKLGMSLVSRPMRTRATVSPVK